MIISSIFVNTRYKNLNHFELLTKVLQKYWVDVTEEDIRAFVINIMIKHGKNSMETGQIKLADKKYKLPEHIREKPLDSLNMTEQT